MIKLPRPCEITVGFTPKIWAVALTILSGIPNTAKICFVIFTTTLLGDGFGSCLMIGYLV